MNGYSAIIVPAGALHNLINTGDKPQRPYTPFGPLNHPDGVLEKSRADALTSTKVFDGVATD